MKCRNCNYLVKSANWNLGNSPLSNSYVDDKNLHRPETYYPLEVFVCPQCLLVQIDEYEQATEIFDSNYAYFSSYSDTLLDHGCRYVDMMIDRFGIDKDWFVAEVASNDGYLLQYFKKKSIPILGIDPAANTAKVAIDKGINTEVEFFNKTTARTLVKKYTQMDLIIANNVLAHNPNLHEFVAGFKTALTPTGIATIEFPHVLTLMKMMAFDSIYHEHYSYFSLHVVIDVFAKHDLKIFDAEEIDTHGGSLRIYIKNSKDTSHKSSSRVKKLLQKEVDFGLTKLETYAKFNEDIKKIKRDLLKLLIRLKEKGNTIVGYGAPAKASTLLNYCGIGPDFLDFTADRSPHKQGKYLPGVKIPILEPDAIDKSKPDYVLILPWNLQAEITRQLSFISKWNGKFIVPIPAPKILTP